MYKAENLHNIGEIMKGIPSEYWIEAQEIRDALNECNKGGKKLVRLQEIAIVFSLGSVYGEDMAISRIEHLERRVRDLTDDNQRLTTALQNPVRHNQTTQDVKQED